MKRTNKSTTLTLPRGQWDKKGWNQYLAEKEELVDQIFKEAERQGLSDEEFAKRAGLCPTTIYRLNNYLTANPCLTTIWKLVKAVGMQLQVKAPASKRKSA